MEAIQTEKLTKYYGKVRGIADLDLSVKEGECFGFIGPNGAGKSTTIRTLLGLITPTSGRASLLGRDIREDNHVIRRDIGYLPSEAVFYPHMKVADVLRFSADLRKKDCTAEASRLCERLQLDPSRKADELSFGNRKKLAIVCALESKPPLLILDEPTGGLDPLMQHEFFEILRERNREGATVFFSSHVLSEIQRICSRTAVIRDGRIAASGSVEDLAKSSAKRVSVSGLFDREGLEGIRDYREEGDTASFLYNGDLQALLTRLAQGRVRDLTISEPDLEEIFLHYYEKEDVRS